MQDPGNDHKIQSAYIKVKTTILAPEITVLALERTVLAPNRLFSHRARTEITQKK